MQVARGWSRPEPWTTEIEEMGRHVAKFAKEMRNYSDGEDPSEGEHRPLIYKFLSELTPNVKVRHEPGPIECGAPDFIVERKGNAVGHIEHKKIGENLRNMRSKKNKEQQERYRKALPNLIYTNGIEWDFYRDGEIVNEVSLRIDRAGDRSELEERLKAFANHEPAPISDPEALAKKMAGKTTMLRIALQNKFKKNDSGSKKILSHYNVFSRGIMWTRGKDEFVKFYAETITYVLFAARMNASDEVEFTRLNAGNSLPENNPFLRQMFHFISSRDLDKDIDWIIDDLVDLLSVCEVSKLMNKFTKVKGKEDPFLHFYETFLEAYDPDRRKEKGVYYTPQQAVRFIVQAVDQILQDELGIKEGLADISTIPGKKCKSGKPLHKVRVLDPATGTGTFLVEIVRHIAPTIKKRARSAWTEYVESHLIPRLHGFEILMAPYAMCFAKIDMVLKSLGYKPSEDPSRLEVYLNDALDLGAKSSKFEGFEWLTEEAALAGEIKDGDKPVMCVIGNPPYSAKASAPEKGSMMEELLEDYKKEPGTTDIPLEEKTTGHLNDLYLQFMRLSTHLVEKNEEGVVALITNNSYLRSPTHRGVRYHLLKTFDRIWIINLHGESLERSPDGGPNQNIFEIAQGVAIIIGVKKRDSNSKNEAACVKYVDLWGTREFKFRKLEVMKISDPIFETISLFPPQFAMEFSDNKNRVSYDEGFGLSEMMPLPKSRSGFVTSKDDFSLAFGENILKKRLQDFSKLDDRDAVRFMKSFVPKIDKKKNFENQFKRIREEVRDLDDSRFEDFPYRPFDKRWVYYTGKSNGMLYRSGIRALNVMRIPNNISIDVTKGFSLGYDYKHVFCHTGICDYTLVSSGPSELCHIFPLMIPEGGIRSNDGHCYNFNPKLFAKISDRVKFAPRGGGGRKSHRGTYLTTSTEFSIAPVIVLFTKSFLELAFLVSRGLRRQMNFGQSRRKAGV